MLIHCFSFVLVLTQFDYCSVDSHLRGDGIAKNDVVSSNVCLSVNIVTLELYQILS